MLVRRRDLDPSGLRRYAGPVVRGLLLFEEEKLTNKTSHLRGFFMPEEGLEPPTRGL